jgi:hypothetical protein
LGEEKIREWPNFNFFLKIALFGHILKKIAHSLLVHGHSSWSTFGLHLVIDPKALYIDSLRNRTMDVESSSRTMERGHLSWSDLMVLGVNGPKAYEITGLVPNLEFMRIKDKSCPSFING